MDRILAIRGEGMLSDVAKPVILVFCLLSLCAVFNTAFLAVSSDMQQKIFDSLDRLALAGTIAVLSGWLFRGPASTAKRRAPLLATLPVQLFCWAAGIMVILFLVSWYLESHCIFYRDLRL